ncbi:MAG: hypothetical protein ACOY0T_31700 [Myxococcota bacterium]
MFTADCDQCGARNKLPASAQDEGINSGSLVPCPNCGAEVCVRRAIDSEADAEVRASASAMPVSHEVTTTPRDEAGEDEATQVLEPSALPDAQPVASADTNAEEPEPSTTRRPSAEASSEPSRISLVPVDPSEGMESAPESLVPLSDRDFIPAEKPARHLPVPPRREAHGASNETSDEPPVSFGTPTLAALVRKATPPPPRRDHDRDRERRNDNELVDDVLVPPAGPIDELWDARVVPMMRQPTATDAPVASVSRPPEVQKEPPRSNGALGFALLVAGVAFVAGLAVKNAKDSESAAPAIPAAAPLADAPAVAPQPGPVAEPAITPPAPPAEPGETAAEASPPPTLAAPETDTKPAVAAPALAPGNAIKPVAAAADAPKSAANAKPASATETPRSTVAPVRSATVSADSPPAEAAFNSEATASALSAAAQRASTCRKPTDPSGVAIVTITFAPSGRVTSANISGPPFAGTETGSCIASVLRSVRVPAYSGDFMTVKKTIQVQ